jgi:hypothetical protein
MNEVYPKSLSLGRWTKVTALGWFLGIILILLLASLFDVMGIEGVQFVVGLGLGGGVGIIQHRALRKVLTRSTRWIWASTLGLGAPFLLFDLISNFVQPLDAWYLPLSISLGAVTISVFQFGLLKKHTHQAIWWIPGCILGWVAAAMTVLSIDYIKLIMHNNWVLFGINLTLILGGGVVLGYVSGKFLVRILNP